MPPKVVKAAAGKPSAAIAPVPTQLIVSAGRMMNHYQALYPAKSQSSRVAILCFDSTRGPLSPSSIPFLFAELLLLQRHNLLNTVFSSGFSRILTTSLPRIGRNLKPCPLPPEQIATPSSPGT